MIIVKLVGGLGNQMFQYAIGKHLSIHHKTILKIDKGILGNEFQKGVTPRKLDLQLLNTEINLASADEIESFTRLNRNRYVRGLMRYFPSFFKKAFISESGYGFHANFLHFPVDTYLLGFWHCSKYFSSIRETLIKEFTPKSAVSENNNTYLNKIKESNSLGIHIRRGDYISNPSASKYHGVLDSSYYYEGVQLISSKQPNLHIFVFSDDAHWVIHNLQFNFPTTYVQNNNDDQSVFDFYLMSQCKHQIIANSTFSWWAAWLNQHIDKMVIAPKKWLSDKKQTWSSVYPEDWILI